MHILLVFFSKRAVQLGARADLPVFPSGRMRSRFSANRSSTNQALRDVDGLFLQALVDRGVVNWV